MHSTVIGGGPEYRSCPPMALSASTQNLNRVCNRVENDLPITAEC
jgi:hypothetical protein